MRRLVAYARVSTSDQADNGYSLGTQLQGCRRWAEDNGYIIVEEYAEDISGTSINRPELNKALVLLEEKSADGLIVFSDDRLSRRPAYAFMLKDKLNELNVELISCSRGKMDSSSSELLFGINAVISGNELSQIKERTYRGKLAKIKSGKWLGANPPPFGYIKEGLKKDTHLIVNEKEADTIRKIFEWAAEGTTLIEISRRLSGVVRPSGLKEWNSDVIKKYIRSTNYRGEHRAGLYSKKLEEYIIVPIPPIVSDQLWQKANDEINHRYRVKRHNKLLFNALFRGRIKCECGGTVSTFKKSVVNKTSYNYYRCHKLGYFPDGSKCGARLYRCELVDEVIFNKLISMISDKELVRSSIVKAREQANAINEKNNTRLKIIDIEKKKLNEYISKLIDDHYINSSISTEHMNNKITEITEHLKRLDQEEKELNYKLVKFVDGEKVIIPILDELLKKRDLLTFEEKRKIVVLLDTSIEFTNNRIMNVSTLLGNFSLPKPIVPRITKN